MAQPVITKIGPNKFKVTYAVPMRRTPKLFFKDYPEGSQPRIIEESNVGFSIEFEPPNIFVDRFNFSADAELY